MFPLSHMDVVIRDLIGGNSVTNFICNGQNMIRLQLPLWKLTKWELSTMFPNIAEVKSAVSSKMTKSQ